MNDRKSPRSRKSFHSKNSSRREKTSSIFFYLALAAGCLFIFNACQQTPAPTQTNAGSAPREHVAGVRGGTVRYRLTSPPKTFNYLLATDEPSIIVSFYLLGGRLAEFNHDEQRYVPSLAESWQMNADGRTVDVTLRDGLKFSDGHPLTSDDVLFSLRAIYDERTNSPIYRAAMMVNEKPITASAQDARHIKFVFPEQVAAPENYLSNLCVLPRHILEANLNAGTMRDAYAVTSAAPQVVTSGAFMLDESKPGERVALKRNPNYWKKDSAGTQLPYLDSLVLEINADANTTMARLDQKTLDIVDRLRPSDYAARRNQTSDVSVYDLGAGLNTDHLWFNLNEGASNGKPFVEPYKLAWFKDARFRRAVSHAVDRESIVASVMQGLATPLYGFVSPGNKQWAADVPKIDYDLEKARASLREAGFAERGGKDAPELYDGENHRVEFTLLAPIENEPRVKMAAVIQEDLAKLGIKMNVAPVEFQSIQQRWQTSFDYEAILLGAAVTEPDPSSYNDFLLSASPTHQWHPREPKPATDWEAKIDELVSAQAREQNAEKRKSLFRDAQMILAEQTPVIPLVARHVTCAANRRVGNYRPSPIFPFSLWNAEELFVKQ